jgi:glycosyltransferase involved in cell wall biosynthesis
MIGDRKVAVVLPAYNAEKTLRRTYDEIPHDIVDDIILTDDCSTDQTVLVAMELGIHIVRHDKNRGYGGNQKSCYTAALARGADIVVMLHPDYQYSPRLVTAMAGMVASGHYDAVFASRILSRGAIEGGMPRYKYVANRLLTAFQNLVMRQKLSEYHTGYRAWSREVLEKLPLLACSDDFVFDNQMIAQAAWHGFRIGEISCPTKYFAEASSINFKRSCIYGLGVLRTTVDYRLSRWKLKQPRLYEPTIDARLPAAVPVQEQAAAIEARYERQRIAA